MYNHPTLTIFGSYGIFFSRPGPRNFDRLHVYIETIIDDKGRVQFRNDKKRCVTLQRAHNNMFTHVARAWCSDACPPAATLVCLTALLMSMQPAPPNPPSTFPTHVDWLMYASMSGSLRPTHTNDVPSHPTARMKHQPSPPALLDGTGLLQMPLQRAQSPEAMQDNRSNWDHMRYTRSHKRQHEPNETPRHSATHTHLRGSSNAPLTALDPPISLPQTSAAIGVHFQPKPYGRTLAQATTEAEARRAREGRDHGRQQTIPHLAICLGPKVPGALCRSGGSVCASNCFKINL